MARYIRYDYPDELRTKRKKRRIRLAFSVFSSLAILISFFVYALFFSGWFSIRGFHLKGNREITEEEIKKTIAPFSNILFAGSANIENSLKKSFPIIRRVEVSKNFFSKYLSLEIEERAAAGIWCRSRGDLCFYFDQDGVFFKPSARFSGEVFLIVEDGRGRDFKLADAFDDQELLEKVRSAKNILDELKITGYSNFFLPPDSFELWIKTKESWYIYLDKESDIPAQLVALKKFLEEKLPLERRLGLQYIDLRVNNRIYYK